MTFRTRTFLLALLVSGLAVLGSAAISAWLLRDQLPSTHRAVAISTLAGIVIAVIAAFRTAAALSERVENLASVAERYVAGEPRPAPIDYGSD